VIYERIRSIAEANQGKIAIDFEGRARTYSEFLREVDSHAATMAARGIGRRSRVCIFLDNSIEFISLQVAIAKLGGVAVPIDYRFASRDIQFVLSDIKPQLVITDAAGLSRL
jgi:acyl-CoA synthetase (AMP-forming)/AMP-acid ligase II